MENREFIYIALELEKYFLNNGIISKEEYSSRLNDYAINN